MDFDMQKNLTLPVLPLRGLVVFPKSLIHFDVGRKKSITAINKAMKADQLVFLTSQKDAAINEPDIFDVYDTGVIAKVVQVLKQPENTTRIVIEGQCRATIINPVFDEKCLVAEVKPYEEESEYLTARDSALMRTVKNEFDKYLEISPKMPSDIIFKVALCKRPGELADFITANLILDYRVKQSILETFPESERLESVLDVLVNENFVLKLEDEISQKAKMRIDENQYCCEYDNPVSNLNFQYHDVYSYYKLAEENDGHYMFITSNYKEDSIKGKFERQFFNEYSSSDTAERNTVRYASAPDKNVQNMVYTDIINLQDGSECFLIVTSSITPLTNTVEIVRDQLAIVSVVFVLLAVIISLYASYRIAKPISKTNTAAKELAKKNYDVDFNARGYLEVEELNETLNYAKTELAATEKLQKELIANISHDLRTPLTMITGYGEVMRDLPGENTPENIQIIIDEATRLSTLVNDLLDLSKIQSGSIQPEKSEFCLTDSIKNIFTRYAKLKEQDGYNILFESDEDVYIFADELKISQVIYNLVNNAVNYVGEDKTVIVTQKVNGKKVLIEVTDHGDGIPPEKLEYIWDRYYKVDKEHKRGVIGTGLGLSIVKGILDSHKARYGVRSTLGKGSTFWFELDIVSVKKRNKKNSDENKE